MAPAFADAGVHPPATAVPRGESHDEAGGGDVVSQNGARLQEVMSD
jgi:hypothetical protein